MSSDQLLISVNRSDMIYFLRAVDTALSELHVVATEGDIKEDVIIELDEVLSIIKNYLK